MLNSEITENSKKIKNQKVKKVKELDFSKQKNFAFKFMYKGEKYEGLVIQNHTENTIEALIIKALKKANLIKNIETANFARCGRTDSGVSSTGNVFSISIRYKPGLKSSDYVKIINNLLPDDIIITGGCEVDDSFDARFSCLYREYKYFFLKRGLSLDKVKSAIKKLEGIHNFKNFCKIDKSDINYMTKNYERRIYEFSLEKYENRIFQCNENTINDYYEMYYVTIKGSAFLWHQVRCMMGIIFLIGNGYEDLDIIDNMFKTEENKIYNYEIASELPLVLSDCQFEGVTFENTIENFSDNYFSVARIFEENLMQIAINSFFLKNIFSAVRMKLPNPIGDEEIIDGFENKYRRKKKYTKLLNHKINRGKK